MTTAQEATAAPYEIRLGNRTFRMSPLTGADIAELDNWLCAYVIRGVMQGIPENASEADRRMMMDVAISRTIGLTWFSGEGARLMSTVPGWAQITWQGVKTNHPDVTPDMLCDLLFDPSSLREAQAAFEIINCCGRAKKNETQNKTHRAGRNKKKRKK